jgi:hypothetical protein
MPIITLNKRSLQSSPLSTAQVDANWSSLEAVIATLGSGSGSVTSVTLARSPNAESILSITNPTITTSGSILLGFQTQSANRFFAAPNGIAGAPEFRTLAVGDLPTVTIAKGGTNSTTALSNNRVMVSSGGAIVESSTIDTTELGFLNGIGGLSAGILKTTGSALTSSSTISLTSEASGILPQANGGTGVSGASNGQLLIGNGTGFVLGTITGGSGISVTSGSGSITITNTGLPSLNTLTGAVVITTGNTGTDFNISTSAPNVVLNIPSSSATNRGLLTSADWSTFNAKEPALTKRNLTEATSSVLTITGGTGAVVGSSATSIQVKQATTTQDGYLSSTDWNTFNSKGSGTVASITAGTGLTGGTITSSGTIAIDSTVATLTGLQTLTNKSISGSTNTLSNIGNASLTNSAITINGTSTSLGGSISVGTVTSVTGTAPVVSSGGATPAISMAAANTTTNGYLTSTDWNTFNSKGSGTVTSVVGTGTVNGLTLTGTVSSSGNLTLGGSLSNINNGQLTNSSITINGSAVSLGGSISVGTVTSVTATSPITSSGGNTPTIAMPAATTSVDGYLTSTDWTTFNSKEPAVTKGNLTEATSSVLTITGGSNAVIGSGTTIQVAQSTGSTSGYLSSTDWTTFNKKIGSNFDSVAGGTLTFAYDVWYTSANATLPVITSGDFGKILFVKNSNNSGNITLSPNTGATIDNEANIGLSHGRLNQGGVMLQATSASTWFILSKTGTIS